MSRYFDKDKLKEELEIAHIYDLLDYWGGEPEYSSKGLIARTICHNPPGEGSRKLYFYEGSRLFACYTGCAGESSFDIFELCIKVMKIQKGLDWELYDAMNYIASYFGFDGVEGPNQDTNELEDWSIIKRHKIPEAREQSIIQLKEYDPVILTRFQYPRILPWEKEGISSEVIKRNRIGYYPGGEQITIPHYDQEGRLVGIRGRCLSTESERTGKYRPIVVNRQLYNHPLSLNLYNLNNSKDAISRAKIAIIYESEKSCMLHQTYYGLENDVSIACCGSNISAYQVELLKRLGARELVIALDRQFQEISDPEFKKLKAKLIHLYNRYNNTIKITAIFDKHMITPYKASPVDEGKEIFEQLLKERIIPHE